MWRGGHGVGLLKCGDPPDAQLEARLSGLGNLWGFKQSRALSHHLAVVCGAVRHREAWRESQGQLGASVAGGQVCTGAWVSPRWPGT